MAKETNNTTVARSEDGNVQITFTVDWKTIESKRKEVASEMAEKITVPGFRKGKAPIEQAIKHLSQEQLTENTLSQILPKLFSKVLEEEKLKPAIYPKFELISAQENEDWQIRAITCELPEVKIADYKKAIKSIKLKKDASKEEKENAVIEKILESTDTTIPEILTEEEVNSRLSSLLQRLEGLGLSLESYLASLNKTAPQLREEYFDQASKSITLDLALQEIATDEKIKVGEKEILDYLKVSSTSKQNEKGFTDQQKSTVELFLRKRKTLDHLVSLI